MALASRGERLPWVWSGGGYIDGSRIAEGRRRASSALGERTQPATR